MKKVIVFFGPPGAGKSTQAEILNKKMNLPVISPGELLRHEEEAGSELGLKIKDIMNQGKMVDAKIVEGVLDKRLSQPDCTEGFILDGYPRYQDQLHFLRERLNKFLSKQDLVIAFYLDVGDEEVKKRLGQRMICDCGASYHLKYNPPKTKGVCDLCGKKLYQRKDDAPEVIENRLKFFHAENRPMLEYFDNNYKMIKINGDRSIEEVNKDILEKINQL